MLIKKRQILLVFVMLFVLLCNGCRKTGEEIAKSIESSIVLENSDALKVYMIGDEMVVNGEESFFFSSYSLGEDFTRALQWGAQGHIYHETLMEYQEKTGVELEIVFFDYPNDLLKQMEVDYANGQMADIVILDATTESFNAYSYMNSQYFCDLTKYCDTLDEQDYFKPIMVGGKQNDKQYYFPLVFNLNIIMASQESIRNEKVWLKTGETYTEYLDLLNEHLMETVSRKGYEGVVQFATPLPYFPYIILDSASGVEFINYEKNNYMVNMEYVETLYKFEKAFLLQAFGENWPRIKEFAQKNQNVLLYAESETDALKRIVLEQKLIEEIRDDILFILEGGSHSTCNYHSALAQLAYYSSKYEDSGENLTFTGIPSFGDPEAYVANVMIWGGVTSACEKPEVAFDVLKYLADSKIPWQMGMSVNRKITEEQITTVSSMEYTLYPQAGKYDPSIKKDTENWDGEPYIIRSLDKELTGEFENIVGKIQKAIFPEEVRSLVFEQILDGIIWDRSLTDIESNISEKLDGYLSRNVP